MRSLVTVLTVLMPASLFAADQPAGKTKLTAGLTYATIKKTELKLDIVTPSQGKGPFPVILCIPGGGWVHCDRTKLRKTLQTLAGRGYAAVTIDYRTAPQHRFPAPIEDCKAAVQWLRAHAKTHNLNPERIGALGFSSGAHLALLLAVTKKEDGLDRERENKDQSSAVQAAVSFFGPCDLSDKNLHETVKKHNLLPLLGGSYFLKSDLYKKASPITYAGKGCPPILFFHGSADPIVPIAQVQAMVKKLKDAGGSATLITVKEEKHGWRGKKLLATLEQMMQFFDRALKR